MMVKFLGYEVSGQLQLEEPPELVERTKQVFLVEYNLKPTENDSAGGPQED